MEKSRRRRSENDIVRLRGFGSFARGEATPESDVDLLADFGGSKGLFDLVQAEDDLAEVFWGYQRHILDAIDRVNSYVRDLDKDAFL